MARQPKRRYGQKTAKSGRRRKTSNDTVEYSRVGARRSRYGEKPWRGSQNDGTGRKRLSRGDVGKRLTTRWTIVGWARGSRDTVKKPWRGSQNDGTGKKRLSRADVGKRLTTRWNIVGWARGARDTVKNHGAPAKTTVPAENG